MTEKRLYGTPGSDMFFQTFDEALDHASDLIGVGFLPGETVTIEEWSVADNRKFFPSNDELIDQICDFIAQEAVTEDWYQAAMAAMSHVVRDTFETAMDLWSDRINFSMAGKKIGEIVVTLEEEDLDNRPENWRHE